MRIWRSIVTLLAGVLLTACSTRPIVDTDTAQAAPAQSAAADLQPSAVPPRASPGAADGSHSQVPADCPVTRPQEPAFVPPEPYATLPSDPAVFWYGSDALWTELYHDGAWRDLPVTDGSYGNKVVFWRQGYVYTEEPEPALSIAGHSLDDPAITFSEDRATNGFHEDYRSFMLLGVNLPAPGCWELTATYRQQSLSFVVWIEP